MPFDGSLVEHEHRVQILAQLASDLKKIRTLLGTEQYWCKGVLHTDDGRHCLVGAVEAVGAHPRTLPVVLAAARGVTRKHYLRVEHFNDCAKTSHADVVAVLDRAQNNVAIGVPLGAGLSLRMKWPAQLVRLGWLKLILWITARTALPPQGSHL